MYLVSFSFSKRQNLNLTLQKHGFVLFFHCVCVCVRVSVNIIEVEASVLHVCSFTLPPVLPLTPVTLPLNFQFFYIHKVRLMLLFWGVLSFFFSLYLTSNLATRFVVASLQPYLG